MNTGLTGGPCGILRLILYTLGLIHKDTMQPTLATPTLLADALLTVQTAIAAEHQPTQSLQICLKHEKVVKNDMLRG